jgi:SAM-dependent methyltransferase
MTEWWRVFFVGDGWHRLQLGWDAAEDVEDEAGRVIEAARLSPGDRVLDAPCGAGRLATALAARGLAVVGLDREPSLLALARERAAARGVTLDLREADLRDPIDTAEPFDAVLCTGGSFGYFDEAGNLAQARAAASALDPGGRYLIDTVSADTLVAHFEPSASFEVGDTAVEIARRYHPETGRLQATWSFDRDDARETYETSVRAYTVDELTDLLLAAGFTSFEARDDALGLFTAEAERLWMVATRG